MTEERKKLGRLLLEAGIINDDQLTTALREQGRWGGKLGENLVRFGFLGESELVKFLAGKFGLPSVELESIEIEEEAVEAVGLELAVKYSAMPFAVKMENNKKVLYLAMSDPTNITGQDDIQARAGMTVKPFIGAISAVREAVDSYYLGRGRAPKQRNLDLDEIREQATAAPPLTAATPEQKCGRPAVFFSEGEERTICFDDDSNEEPSTGARDGDYESETGLLRKSLAMNETLARLLIRKGVLTREEISGLFGSLTGRKNSATQYN